jgi:hypothetical protein
MLHEMPLRVAVVDSGINLSHSHIGNVAGGISFVSETWEDRVGHGTAVAAAIRDHEPRVDLFSVKIFERSFSTDIESVVKALEWCADHQMDVVNLSLATAKLSHAELLREPSRRIKVLVAPFEFVGLPAYPGSFPWAFGVSPDPQLRRDQIREANGTFFASPLPRTIPGLAPQDNFTGSSFAAANFTGLICRVMLDRDLRTVDDIRSALSAFSR